jgi:hypothetical protein
MANEVKKFFNPSFLKVVDLDLLGKLFARHGSDLAALDPAALDLTNPGARGLLQAFLTGPEDTYPARLLVDLHRIAELATSDGAHLLRETASGFGRELVSASEREGAAEHLHPKHLALRAFLEQPEVFNRAADGLIIERGSSLAEFSGADEGVEPELSAATKAEFERQARAMFQADLQGRFCRVGWYDDAEEVNVVVSHGGLMVSTATVQDGDESAVSYRRLESAHLTYNLATGRLKVGGVPKAQRPKLAEMFANIMLRRPNFFAGDGSGRLYCLKAIERAGGGFEIERRFDTGIRSAKLVEMQVEKLAETAPGGRAPAPWSLVIRDRENALKRLADITGSVLFGPGRYRLSYVVLALEFENAGARPVKLRVKLKPPAMAQFKRHRFEASVMELLRRNGLTSDRRLGSTTFAAE